MKRALSIILLSVLLLGLLPALAPPARMITFALFKANRTSAYVGDKVTWRSAMKSEVHRIPTYSR